MKARKARNGVVAAVHEQHGKLVALVMRDGGGERRPVDTVECAAGATGELTTWLAARGVTRLVRITPLRESLCKTAALAAVNDEAALSQSIALMAEGALPVGVYPWRRAGAPLHTNVGGAILTAWLRRVVTESLTDLPETWITPHGALAAIWDGKGLALYSDRKEGAAAILMATPAGAVARLAVESPAEANAWGRALAGVVAETAHAAGANVAEATTLREGLVLDAGSIARLRDEVPGASDSEPWLNTFGLCAGALLAATSRRESVRALANLHGAQPPRERSPAEVVIEWLLNPVNAWMLAAACIVLAVTLPWTFAYGRQKVLQSRAAKFEKFNGGVGDIEMKGALYSQLDRSRWPMTKLLTDISRAAPEGITAINLRLANGQPLNLHGSARTPDLVNEFQARLTKTKVFGKVTVGRVEAKGDGVEFDLAADVVQPNLPVTGADDFATPGKTLAERLYGAGASNTAVAAKPEGSDSRPGRRERDSNRDRETETTASKDAGSGPPPPVSDAEIAKMSRVEAVKGWTSRRAYVQKNPGLEAAVKDRLQDEEQKMRAHSDALKGAK
ncbi:MAG: PilN domain-containing protein [Phycisphaerales bacterium]|jgi:hypothetical protein